MRTILHNCRGPRLLPKLCDELARDRSSKLRQCCADALLQVRKGPAAPQAVLSPASRLTVGLSVGLE